MTLFLLALLAGLLGLARPAQAAPAGQGDAPRFDRLTIDDGLARNTVLDILQDRRGLIWIATPAGLNRYDGYEFSLFAHDPANPASLSAGGALALLEDSRGSLWVGTGTGLDRFDRRAQAFTRVISGLPQPVSALAEDAAGQVWIGTAGAGLLRLDPTSGQISDFRHDPADPTALASDRVYALLLDGAGRLWIGTAAGLDRLDPDGGGFAHYLPERAKPDSPSAAGILALAPAGADSLWLGTDGGGLNRLEVASGRFRFFLPSRVDPHSLDGTRVSALRVDGQGRLWAATENGLNRLDPDGTGFLRIRPDPANPDSLPPSPIECLFSGPDGVLWAGTQTAGLALLRPSANQFGRLQLPGSDGQPLLDGSVRAAAEDSQGRLWLAGGNGSLSRLSQAGGWEAYLPQADAAAGLSASPAADLLVDAQDKLWIATSGGGLQRLDPDSGTVQHYRYTGQPGGLLSNTLCCLLADQAGGLWVGTSDAGLQHLDPAVGTFTTVLADERISSLALAPDGTLWAGTDRSGVRLIGPDGRAGMPPAGLDDEPITWMAAGPAGEMWLGSGSALLRFDPAQESLTRFPLPVAAGNAVSCALPGRPGELWVSSVYGLLRLDLASGSFTSYGVSDGLQGREFLPGSCLRSGAGALLFGGIQGANRFDPAALMERAAPPVQITGFQSAGSPARAALDAGESITLDRQADWISFHFAALDFDIPSEQRRYRYRLTGAYPDWVEAGSQHAARYTGLRPGEYRFEVQAAGPGGVWSQPGAAANVRIPTPWWQTLWFRAAAILALAAGLAGAYRLRVARVEAHNRRLREQVAELSEQVRAAAVAAERVRVARGLHDSVTQSLYSLTLFLEASQRALERGELSQGKDLGAQAAQVSQQALQEMRLMVFQLRPPVLAEAGLAGALEHRLECVERRAGLDARLTICGQPQLPPAVEEELYYLAQEALNNALKHAGASRTRVRLECRGSAVTLEIEDDGRGFDPARAAHSGGLGLTGMRERANRLNARLEIGPAEGSGTLVRLALDLHGLPAALELDPQKEEKPG